MENTRSQQPCEHYKLPSKHKLRKQKVHIRRSCRSKLQLKVSNRSQSSYSLLKIGKVFKIDASETFIYNNGTSRSGRYSWHHTNINPLALNDACRHHLLVCA